MLKDDFFQVVEHFNKEEFDCKCGCGLNNVSQALVSKLDLARKIASIPFKINSACRCVTHNHNVSGSLGSSHTKGYAVDININNSSNRFKILDSLIASGFNRIGVYKNFIHVDIDHDKTQNVIWYK